jgi:hypothetical protein
VKSYFPTKIALFSDDFKPMGWNSLGDSLQCMREENGKSCGVAEVFRIICAVLLVIIHFIL